MTFQTYNLNIPDPPHRPSSDVPLMKTNTNSISSLLLQDHFGFNDNSGGNHKQVHLVNEAAPGTGAFADAVLFANNPVADSWPFWQNALGTTQIISEFPTTTTDVNGTGSTTTITSIAGGLKVSVGFATNGKDGSTINFSTTFTTIIYAGLCALGNSSTGTNRALVAQARSINAGAGTMVLNLQDVNNNSQSSSRTVYFLIIGT